MPDAAARWNAVAVAYPYARRPAVGPVDLELRRGEKLLLLGPSGSGKSTLLATLTGLVPRVVPATVTGEVTLSGRPVAERSPAAWADTVAYLFQDADQTLCGMSVADEVAFALENRGLPAAEIGPCVAAAMRAAGVAEALAERRTMTLSGGEKQLVALAAVLAQDADVLVADEPTAHLAPAAAARLHRLLTEGMAGRTALIVDHRLDGLIGAIDRVAVLGGDGALIAVGAPGSVFREHGARLAGEGIWRPLAARLDAALAAEGLAPDEPILDLAAAVARLGPPCARTRRAVAPILEGQVAAASPGGPVVARLEAADCAPFRGPVVLRGVTMEIAAGEVLAILGANGAGKSTLGATLAGLLPLRGGRRAGPAGGMSFQNPEAQFTAGSVRDEIAAAAGRAPGEAERVLAACGLAEVADVHPFELSQGQKRRLALAMLTARDRWPLLVLDEPMAGLDARGAEQIEREIARLAGLGRAVAVVTHDIDLALRRCPRAIVLGGGRVLAAGPTPALLADECLLAAAGLAPPAIAPLLRWSAGAC